MTFIYVDLVSKLFFLQSLCTFIAISASVLAKADVFNACFATVFTI